MHSGDRGGEDALAVSGHTVRVAGHYCPNPTACGDGVGLPLMLRWTGNGWQRTFLPGTDVHVFGVAATSPADAWAVGTEEPRTTFIWHWDGRTWS